MEDANDNHELTQFACDPSDLINDGKDVWETWDKILNRLLQCMKDELKLLVQRGEKGLVELH
jgi:hypothetical protein